MKILHIVDLISKETGGGTAQVAYYLSQEQAKLGHDVTIYCSDTKAGKQEAPEGVVLKKFHSIYYLLKAWSLTPGMLFADFKSYDVVHLHNYRTIVNLIAGLRSKKLILQAHGNCQNISGITGFIYHLVWRNIVFKRCKGFIADAELEINQYMAEGADRSKITTIPVGIDLGGEFAHIPKRQPSAKKRVLFLGRLHEVKGPDLLAMAFKLLSRDDVVLIVAGIDYGYEATFRQQVKDLGIEDKVEYLVGGCFGAIKVKEFTNADVYVMPSRYEMFGITFLEALACGTSVIMTDRCGAASLLPQECGTVVPFDEYALATAINEALNKGVANSYRQYRRDWAKQYGWAKIAPRIIEYYEKVLSR